MGLTFILKDGKPSYTTMREKYNAVIKLKAAKSVKIYKIQKNKFQWTEECDKYMSL